MDPFTKGILERAEQRSRTLGISKSTKFPLAEYEQKANQQAEERQQLIAKQKSDRESGSGSPTKVVRNFSVDKENMDVGIEINITTDKNVEVQVEVEEREIDADGNCTARIDEPQAKIRDCSRNRLQRLGALYSDTENLSSPIHRTEAHFHEEDQPMETNVKRPKHKFGKLAALADSINTWEDDTSHPDYKSTRLVDKKSTKGRAPPPPTGSPQKNCPSSTTAPSSSSSSPQRRSNKSPAKVAPATADALPASTKSDLQQKKMQWEKSIMAEKERAAAPSAPAKGTKDKKLHWDKTVMDSLEAQGFQRRESDQTKISYNYSSSEDKSDSHTSKQSQSKTTTASLVFETKSVSTQHKTTAPPKSKQSTEETSKAPQVRTGLVSGRAAVFESKASVSAKPAKPQKDPAEMSMKERMMFFEKNKGEALVPKAAFAMSVPVGGKGRDETKGKDSERTEQNSKPKVTCAIAKADGKVRDKVAALTAASSTISENKIKADMEKQRQHDMQLLTKRFQRQKEYSESSTSVAEVEIKSSSSPSSKISKNNNKKMMAPPPPPPPIPQSPGKQTKKQSANHKRRSPGCSYNNRDDDRDALSISDEKRIKVNPTGKPGRLYPVLSDIEITSESDNDNCTSATVSLRSGVDDGSSGGGDKQKFYPDAINGIGVAKRQQYGDSDTIDEENERDDDDGDYEDEDDEDDDSKKELNESFVESDDSESGICNVSLGREIMQVVRSNEVLQNSARKDNKYNERDAYYAGDSSLNSGMTSDGSADVDDYLDEALDDESESESDSHAKRNVKGTTNSHSFSYKKQPKTHTQYNTINEEGEFNCNNQNLDFKSPVKSALTINPSDDDNMVTLVHTVSFYRRQQSSNSNNSTPVRRIVREQKSPVSSSSDQRMDSDNYNDDPDSDQENAYLAQEKIKKLLDEVCKQQQVIGQTSQALNLCAATIEFSGSTESVEGERHLLVATHRRQAALDEVQRLRVESSIRPHGAPKEKGRLTVREIIVPLRQDYIRKLSADTISGHHLVCLLKYNENVLATRTIPTLPGLMAVKFPDVLQLNNVYADFKITMEIYGMTAQREVLPHDVKYHINMNKKSGGKTPKKKGADSRLIMPMVQSPAGPNVVRTPALVQYGFAIFSLREIQRNSWSLTPVSGVSPLEGIIHMKINCELSVSVEYTGFLTMFEDISGFGAWHRRWCHLNGHVLNYWKYPDDEKKKAPLGSIDLYSCCSTKVTTAPRDVCARLNTLLLECQRPAEPNDVESLIIVPHGKTTIVRHLLSADTKEERDEWTAYFNKALTLLRAWGSQNQ